MAAKMLSFRSQQRWQYRSLSALLLGFLSLCVLSCAPRYNLRFGSDRWQQANDRKPISIPNERTESLFLDGAEMQLFYQLERLGTLSERSQSSSYHFGFGNKQEALNVNNFDEVADSTWFTNRVGRSTAGKPVMTDDEIAQGPKLSTGPETTGPWTILSAKTQGQTPGFFLKDARGDIYIVKFDPPGYAEIASGAEMISTSFFHAFGYNVPENYIVRFDPKILTLSPKAKTKDLLGNKVPFTQEKLQKVLNKIQVGNDGLIRALASKIFKRHTTRAHSVPRCS